MVRQGYVQGVPAFGSRPPAKVSLTAATNFESDSSRCGLIASIACPQPVGREITRGGHGRESKMVDLFHSLLHEIFDPPGSMLGQSAEALGSLGLGFPELSLIFIVLAVCITLPWFRIFRKAGYSPARGFLMFIPIVNIIVFCKFAYGE
jgi:hypothetical protein